MPVPEGKTSKNRLHPGFRPDDHEAEVDRLLFLGARRADTVQDEQHWVTLLDPSRLRSCHSHTAPTVSPPPWLQRGDGNSTMVIHQR